MEYIRMNNGYIETTAEDFCRGQFTIPAYDTEWDLQDPIYTLPEHFSEVFHMLFPTGKELEKRQLAKNPSATDAWTSVILIHLYHRASINITFIICENNILQPKLFTRRVEPGWEMLSEMFQVAWFSAIYQTKPVLQDWLLPICADVFPILTFLM